jgi:hypothetical protein
MGRPDEALRRRRGLRHRSSTDLPTVATLHGIWSGAPGYAAPFFAALRQAGRRFRRAELRWPGARLGPLALPLLRVPSFRDRQEADLRRLFAAVPAEEVILVTHSAGAAISYALLARLRYPVRAYWTGGCFARLLGFDAPLPTKWRGIREAEPALVDRLTLLAARLAPRTGTVAVPWTNTYYAADPLAEPLAPWGAPCRDVELHVAPGALVDHGRYWLEPAYARAVSGSL